MFKRIFVSLLIVGTIITGCSKNDNESESKNTEITVLLKDGKGEPLSQWVVYAYNEVAWRANSILAAKQSATDSSGKAVFSLGETDIDVSDNQEVYRFVVYYTKTKTNILADKRTSETLEKIVTITIKQGENQTIEINLEGTTNNNGGNNGGGNNNGNNNGNIVKQPADIFVVLKDTEGNPLSNAKVVIGGIIQKTDENGRTQAFKGETNSTYEWEATTFCGETKTGTLATGSKGLEYVIDTFTSEKGTLVITNKSDNPYTITIGNKSWIIKGKATENFTIALNTSYNVHYKQNSGYLLSPTEGNKPAKADCKTKTVAVTFPDFKF